MVMVHARLRLPEVHRPQPGFIGPEIRWLGQRFELRGQCGKRSQLAPILRSDVLREELPRNSSTYAPNRHGRRFTRPHLDFGPAGHWSSHRPIEIKAETSMRYSF